MTIDIEREGFSQDVLAKPKWPLLIQILFLPECIRSTNWWFALKYQKTCSFYNGDLAVSRMERQLSPALNFLFGKRQWETRAKLQMDHGIVCGFVTKQKKKRKEKENRREIGRCVDACADGFWMIAMISTISIRQHFGNIGMDVRLMTE